MAILSWSYPVLLYRIPALNSMLYYTVLCSTFLRGRQSTSTNFQFIIQKFNVPVIMSEVWILLALLAYLVVIGIFLWSSLVLLWSELSHEVMLRRKYQTKPATFYMPAQALSDDLQFWSTITFSSNCSTQRIMRSGLSYQPINPSYTG